MNIGIEDVFAAFVVGVLLTCAVAIPTTLGCTSAAWKNESVAVGAAEYVMTPDSKLPKWQWKPKAEKAQ